MSYDQRRRPPSPRRFRDDGMYHFRGNSRQDHPRHDFNFRAPAHSAPSFPPTGPRRDRNERRDRGPSRRGGFGRGGYRKPGASERAILNTRRSPTPEQLPGMNTGDSRFRILEDLGSQSGDDDGIQEDSASKAEAVIDTVPSRPIDDDDSEDDDHPRAKRARIGGNDMDKAVEDAKPKWSNPDPYTALPPPGQSQGPKMDVLKMIRNAKVEQENTAQQAAGVDEFISLNFGDDDVGDASSEKSEHDTRPMRHDRDRSPALGFTIRGNARNPVDVDSRDSRTMRPDHRVPHDDRRWDPRDERSYSRYGRGRSRSPPGREQGYSRYSTSPEDFDRRSSRYPPHPRDRHPAYRSPPPLSYDAYSDPRSQYPDSRNAPAYLNGHEARLPPLPSTALNVWPPPPPPPPPRYPADHNAPLPPSAPPPEYSRPLYPGYANENTGETLSKRKRQVLERPAYNIDATPLWLPRTRGDSTPWMTYCDPSGIDSQIWLHDEIESFFNYVSPRESEQYMRGDLIRRVTDAVTAELGTVEVKPFGSSATSMYLPTGDVDLVVLSSHYLRSGYPHLPVNRGSLNRFIRNVIRNRHLAVGQVQAIPNAKVPLIKFHDLKTGLPVDISFENDSGLTAIGTLNNWLGVYPALSRLVHPIKQFLKMRGKNEVNTGGLGGFSTICLVAFRLHVLSEQKGADWAMRNLDLALIDIFEFYGNTFDREVNGLDMQNMRVIPKSYFTGRVSKPGRLLIVDPNNRENDISGGTAKIKEIFEMFSVAASSLRKEVEVVRNTRSADLPRHSMLKCVLAGDYTTFDSSRERLERLYADERPISKTNDVVDLTASDDGEYVPSDDVVITDVRSNEVPVSNNANIASVSQSVIPGLSSHSRHSNVQQQPQISSNRPKSLRSAHVQQELATSSSAPTAPKRKAPDQKQQEPARPQKKVKQPVPAAPKAPKASKAALQTKQIQDKATKEKDKKKRRKEQKKGKENKAQVSSASEQNIPVSAKGNGAKPKKSKNNEKQLQNEQRARSFKERFPGVKCPDELDKGSFRNLVKKQPQAA